MPLRYKTIILTFLMLTCLIAVVYFVSRAILLRGFEKLEQWQVRENVERVLSAIDNDIKSIDSMARDWAAWDDTYAFINDGNEGYIKSTLANESFINLRLNTVFFIDKSGKIVYKEYFDLKDQEERDVPDSLLTKFSISSPFLVHKTPNESVTGIVVLPEGPMLLVSQPIVMSDGSGPIRGSLIFGRYLDDVEIKKLRETTHLDINILRIDGDLPSKFQTALSKLSERNEIQVQPLSMDSVEGYALLKDVYGTPALVLGIEMPRLIYSQGRYSLNYFLLALLATGFLFALVINGQLDRSVLSRLALLSSEVGKIAKSGDHGERLTVRGKDELFRVADAINGMLSSLDLSMKEIMAAKEHSAKLDSARSYLESIINTTDDAIILSNMDGDIQIYNKASTHIFGYSGSELKNLNIANLYDKNGLRDLSNHVLQLIEHGKVHYETTGCRKDGQVFPMEVSANVMKDIQTKTINNIVYVLRNITERQHQKELLSYMATHDPMTGIPNRRLFEEALNRTVARAQRGKKSALLFIDLDNFKIINDIYGHVIGDKVLVVLAKALEKILRKGDVLARFGGDEFTILLESISIERSKSIAERLRNSISKLKVNLGDYDFDLSISIGLVPITGKETLGTLMSMADKAMHQAKEQGRNQVVIYTTAEPSYGHVYDADEMIIKIKDALKKKQILLYFQPIVRLSDEKIEWYEVLARLPDGRNKIILPGVFIPIAERFGLMNKITYLIIEQSIQKLKDNPKITLFINLSTKCFLDEFLLKFIEDQIKKSGIDPSRLGFEITETSMLYDLDKALIWIQRIRTLGCQFALDDFGSGFSSLNLLSTLPIDQFKIDGSLIRNLDNNPEKIAMIQAIHMLAKSMGKETVAECIENKTSAQIMKKIGINYAQGYYFARPSQYLCDEDTLRVKKTVV